MKKKKTGLWVGMVAIGVLFFGCGKINSAQNNETAVSNTDANEASGIINNTLAADNSLHTSDETDSAQMSPQINSETISLKIVDGAKKEELILAGKGANDVYSLPLKDIPVYLDGKSADASALKDGITVTISYDGSVLETFPAKLGSVDGIYAYSQISDNTAGETPYDLSGLYLKVLEDLWDTDPALNEDSQYISIDLSQAPGNLTEGEKSAIAWIFASKHNAEPMTLSYQELVDQGYVKEMAWKNGILFCIKRIGKQKKSANKQQLNFDASKWRSGDGAIFFNNCTASPTKDGIWTDYAVGNFAIS